MTACGRSKEDRPMPTWRLYRSSRIRYLKKVADSVGVDYAILSAEYGLVPSKQVIEPYDRVMDDDRCAELFPEIVEALRRMGVDTVVFYRGGARKEYYECIKRAAESAGVRLISVGYAQMGDIGKVKGVLEELLGKA